MPLDTRFRVGHRHRDAFARALTDLFAAEAGRWTVTIGPSPTDANWTVEVLGPGRFCAFGARPAEQDPESIVALVRAAIGLHGDPHSHE